MNEYFITNIGISLLLAIVTVLCFVPQYKKLTQGNRYCIACGKHVPPTSILQGGRLSHLCGEPCRQSLINTTFRQLLLRHWSREEEHIREQNVKKYGHWLAKVIPVNIFTDVRHLNYKEWQFCVKYFNNGCAYCGINPGIGGLALEHVISISKAGRTTANNVVPACTRCNSVKGTKTLQEYYDYCADIGEGIAEARKQKIIDYFNLPHWIATNYKYKGAYEKLDDFYEKLLSEKPKRKR